MSLRKTTSLTAALAFVVVLLTSVILYIVPQGRVAYWADWRLWGLTKEQWGDVHITVGLLFLLSLGLHIYYNWKPLLAYLKNRSRRMRVFTPAFNLALAVCAVTVAGTLVGLPPFSWVLTLNDALKDAGAAKYGEPPYGHAELSTLESFARKVNLDPQAAIVRLRSAGFTVVDGEQSLKALAAANRTTPKTLYAAMQTAEKPAGSGAGILPDAPPPGTGRLRLSDLCRTYGIDPQRLLAALKARNIDAGAEESLRDIADRHGMGPQDLYAAVKAAADSLRAGG